MQNRNRALANSRRGFSLIEVMIVILIVLAIGGLVAYNVMGAKEKADARLGKIQLQEIQKALRQFKVTQKRYPTEEEGIQVLWSKEAITDEEATKLWEKLLEKPMPKDSWGNEWGYRQVSEHGDESMYDLWSYGPDRVEGTEDDITSWEGMEDTDSGTGDKGGPSGTGATKGG
ncbi:MAG: type II secretion system major pseudopilin GspG [Phycisphaerales bacterium]